MIARWMAVLWITAILVGCASDGGPTGTGIATSISGNVIDVETSTDSQSETSAVKVTIDEVPEVEDTTDAEGAFALTGSFSGSVTLRFTAPDIDAAQPLEIPAGSSVVLEDVVLNPKSVHIRAARQLGFTGTVALVDCTTGDLLIDDKAQRRNQFLVQILADTILVDGNGNSISCSDIKGGEPVAVEGSIQLDRRIIRAIAVTVNPPGPGDPPVVVETSFAGTIKVINCHSEMAQIEGETGTVRLVLSPQSDLLDATGQPIECEEIAPETVVVGDGYMRVRRPEVVQVVELRIVPQ